jgi:hypothetical protein
MLDNWKDDLVAKFVANQALGWALRVTARVADCERNAKQQADKAAERDKDYRVLTSLGSTQSSPTATPRTHNYPTDGSLPGGALVHGGAPLIDTSGTVSPTTSIDSTGETTTIDGNEGMPELGITGLEELSTNPALSLLTNAINQDDVELTEDIANEVKLPPLFPHRAPNLLSLEATNRAILALTKQISAFTQDISRMQDTVNLLSWRFGSSISKLANEVHLIKESITNVSKSVNFGVKAHQRVQDVEASQDDLRRDINALHDTQVQDTKSLG